MAARPHLPLESHPASPPRPARRAATSAAEAKVRQLAILPRSCLSLLGIRRRHCDQFAADTEFSLKSRRRALLVLFRR